MGGSPHRCSRPYGRPGGPQLGAGGGGAGGCGIPPPPALHARVSRTERVCMGGGGGSAARGAAHAQRRGGGSALTAGHARSARPAGPCTLTDKCARAHCAQPAAHARLHTHVDPGSFARSALSVQACTVPRSLAHATLPPCTLASPCAHTGAVHTRRMKLARSPLPVPAHALHDGSVALHAHLQVCKLMLRQQALHAQLRGLAHSPPAVQVHTEP